MSSPPEVQHPPTGGGEPAGAPPPTAPNDESNPFLALLNSNKPVVCAEGYLFEMERRGYLQFGPFVPTVSVTDPSAVKQLHKEFVNAGSDIVLAFTYYANRAKLRLINQEHLLEKTNLAALAIAKEVVAEHPGTILAGNVCNTTAYSPGDEKTHEEARLMFREQIGWAKESGCSLIVGETFDHYGEAKIALEEINAAGLPAVITFALANWLSGEKKGDAFLLQDDVPIVEACLKLHRMGAAVVGLNCHRGPETIMTALEHLRAHLPKEVRLAGLPVAYRCTHAHPTMQELSQSVCEETGRKAMYTNLDCYTSTRYDWSRFGEKCLEQNIQYVGTCCGAAAHHVRALSLAVGKTPPSAKFEADLDKHFVVGKEEDLAAVGNVKGSFLEKGRVGAGANA